MTAMAAQGGYSPESSPAESAATGACIIPEECQQHRLMAWVDRKLRALLQSDAVRHLSCPPEMHHGRVQREHQQPSALQ